jgi:hypothetical protein
MVDTLKELLRRGNDGKSIEVGNLAISVERNNNKEPT